MKRESGARDGLRRAPLMLFASFAVIASATATAAQPAAPGNDGVMQFKNVRVVNAPSVNVAQAAPQPGMRAYIDPTTGALRSPTPEEMQAAAAEHAALQASQARQLRAAPPSIIFPKAGGVGMRLDESFMQYAVVVRQADGSLGEVCVPGADKADEVVRTQPVIRAAQHMENSHAR